MRDQGRRHGYPSDLTDAEWQVVKEVLPVRAGPGRPHRVDLREVLDGLLYLTRTGCQWRLLPHDFPYWGTVRYYFDKWRDDRTWVRLNDVLREKVRIKDGRDPQPSAAIIDSQSAKTTEVGGERGYDANKKSVGAQTSGARGYHGESAARRGTRGRLVG